MTKMEFIKYNMNLKWNKMALKKRYHVIVNKLFLYI